MYTFITDRTSADVEAFKFLLIQAQDGWEELTFEEKEQIKNTNPQYENRAVFGKLTAERVTKYINAMSLLMIDRGYEVPPFNSEPFIREVSTSDYGLIRREPFTMWINYINTVIPSIPYFALQMEDTKKAIDWDFDKRKSINYDILNRLEYFSQWIYNVYSVNTDFIRSGTLHFGQGLIL